jgi:hypothetical protein
LQKEHTWTSVRKVRYRSQFLAIVKFAVENDGKPFDEEKLRALLVEDRIEKEEARLRGSQHQRLQIPSLRNQLGALTKDFVSFGKALRLFDIEDDKIVASQLSRQIWKNSADGGADEEIIRVVLNSTYDSYRKLLLRLDALGGEIRLPADSGQRDRNSELSKILLEKGIDVDTASFFTLRDFMYDLGLVNWYFDAKQREEVIYLTCRFWPSKGVRFRKKVMVDKEILRYDREMGLSAFENALKERYLLLTRGKWGVWVDTLEFRDQVAFTLKISDRSFDASVEALVEHGGRALKVDPSQGYNVTRVNYGYSIKSLSLPRTKKGALIRYVSIQPKELN